MIVDLYTHILPGAVTDAMATLGGKFGLVKRLMEVRELHDLDQRFRTMDALGDYGQVSSLPNPPLEAFTTPGQAVDIARVANDALADLVAQHPHRFPAFVAALPCHDIEATLAELHRAVDQLGAKGVQLFTNVDGVPIDDPRFAPLFAAMAGRDLPVFLHPARSAAFPDYAAESFSRFEMWWCFGWPYETSVAMARLVLTGLFDRHPAMKIVTHHCGGMVPFFDKRIDQGLAVLGARTKEEDYSAVLPSLKRPHIDYFRDFYADTALFGGTLGVECGLRFFGAEKIVFATDAPFGPVAATRDAIDAIDLAPEARAAILSGNAGRLLNMSFA